MAPLFLFLVICLASTNFALYSKSSPVKVLDAAEFQSKVKNGNDVWLVEFFAPWCGHCKSLAPDFERTAKALQGIVKVAAVEDQSVMASEGVKGFPTIKLYLGKGNGVTVYEQARIAEGIVSFVGKELASLAQKRLSGKTNGKEGKKKSSKSDVVELTDDNFDSLVMADEKSVWFVEFYAPWCGHCKALAPTWEEVATSAKGKVKIAKIDATANPSLGARFGVKGYPTLKLFPSGPKSDSSVVPYNGERDAESLLKFAMGFAGDAVKAVQLLTDEQFKEECAKSVCIISFLPHILDSGAKGRNAYLKQLNQAVKSSVSMPVKFFWLQGGDNFSLEEALHLQFGYPAVLAMRLEKEKFAVHMGDFSGASIRSFLTGLMSGKNALQPIPKQLPSFSTVAKWDGKDGEPPASHDDEL